MRVKVLIVLIYCITAANARAQELAHYKIGEDELRDKDIYGLLYSLDHNLYITSNQGVDIYDGSTFRSLPISDKILGKSFFSPQENSKGEIFCFTLKGSFCKITGDSVILYHQILKDKANSKYEYAISKKDEIIVTGLSTGLLRLKNGKARYLKGPKTSNNSRKSYSGTIRKRPNGHLVISHNWGNKIYYWDQDSLRYYKGLHLRSRDLKRNTMIGVIFFSLGGELYYKDERNIMNLNQSTPLGKTHFDEAIISISDSIAIGIDHTKGIRLIRPIGSELNISNYFFQNTALSCFTVGPNKTIYFGSFGEGIYVVPNIGAMRTYTHKSGPKLNHIYAQKGEILVENNKKQLLVKNGESLTPDMKNFFRLNNDNLRLKRKLSTSTLNYSTLNGKPHFRGFKDIIDCEDFLIARHQKGISAICEGDSEFINNSSWHKGLHSNTYELKEDILRPVGLAYEAYTRKIYCANSTALYELDETGQKKEVKHNGHPIGCISLSKIDDIIYGSSNHGNFTLINGKISYIDSSTKLKITQWRASADQLFALTDKNRIYAYNKKSDQFIPLGLEDGIIGNVTDIDINEDTLYYLQNRRNVIKVPLNSIDINSVSKFNIALSSIAIANKKIRQDYLSQLKHNENQLNFIYKTSPLSLNATYQVYHRLKGQDSRWQLHTGNTPTLAFMNLNPGDYTLQLKAISGYESTKTSSYHFTIQEPYWNTWWFRTLLLVVTLSIILSIFYFRVRWIKRKANDSIAQQKLKTDLVDSQLTALRSQMNPHFIFNSLNSIQDLILREETEASYDYIVLFSELVRSTLNFSNQNFVSMKEEFEFLKVYLKLEKLRFGDEFTYSVNLPEKLELELPSMLIQPFIENALLHGLLHKKGSKSLNITFNLEQSLRCVITDNGVGRAKSKAIKERQGGNHQSFALESIEKRLAILQEKYDYKVGYAIHDLYDRGESAGTKVEIDMPYKWL